MKMKPDKISNNKLYLAVSFSGKDREYVLSVVNELKKYMPSENIFYDSDYSEELSGKELFEYLRCIYAEKSKYVMCFFSKNYNESNWAKVEVSAIKDRLFLNFMDSSFLIPIVMDGTANFLPATIGFWAKDNFSVEEIAQMTIHKIQTGESLHLTFPTIFDLDDLAFSIKNTFSKRLNTLNKKYICNLTDEGYCFTVNKGDCSINFWVEYKTLGLRALLLRVAYTDCSLKKITQSNKFSPLSCNAFVTNISGAFFIHDFNLFDSVYENVTGNNALSIITDKFLEKLNEGCICLF